MSKQIKAIDEAKEDLKPILNAVKDIHNTLCDDNGLCGSHICSLMYNIENNLNAFINNTAQGLINAG